MFYLKNILKFNTKEKYYLTNQLIRNKLYIKKMYNILIVKFDYYSLAKW